MLLPLTYLWDASASHTNRATVVGEFDASFSELYIVQVLVERGLVPGRSGIVSTWFVVAGFFPLLWGFLLLHGSPTQGSVGLADGEHLQLLQHSLVLFNCFESHFLILRYLLPSLVASLA